MSPEHLPNPMSTDPRIEAAAAALLTFETTTLPLDEVPGPRAREMRRKATAALAAADKAATIDPGVEHFINERPGYITALKNTRATDEQSDYWRWSGNAEARRQLATVLGYTVPHEPGEATKRATE